MALRDRTAFGVEYLDLVTRLLQRCRVADPTAGLWEAADLQWWWRRDRPSDHAGQLFWLDDRDNPVAGVVVTDWFRAWACDVIVLPDQADSVFGLVWEGALDRITDLGLETVEMTARDDDAVTLDALASAGFTPTADGGTTTWLDAARRPDVTPLPSGFRLLSRAQAGDRRHHMAGRNGDQVAERLAQCSLYQPELDLMIEAPSGDVAAYALFWADPITGVGLVEPMRTEAEYQRRGLARHLLTTGVDRLAARGCERLKISYEAGNPASQNLYLGVGFAAESTARVYQRQLI